MRPLTSQPPSTGLAVGAEGDRAGRGGAAFGKRLGVDGAVADDALEVQLRRASCSARCAAVMARPSASTPVHSVEQTCMLQVSAVAPQKRPSSAAASQ